MLSNTVEKVFSLSFLGLKYSFFTFSYSLFLDVIFIHIILYTLFLSCAYFLRQHKEKVVFLSNSQQQVINLVYYAYLSLGNFIVEFIIDNIKKCNKKIFTFVCSFFSVLLLYNIAWLFPHLHEPTKNLNVALAFALYGFFYIQYIAIKENSAHYITHWVTQPIKHIEAKNIFLWYFLLAVKIIINTIVTLVLLPFQLLERFSLIFSLTFRLFGNMFGGSIVIDLLHKMQHASLIYYFGSTILGIQSLVFFYFGLFEGIIQAFVFTLVLLNNVGMLVNKDN